MPVLTPFDENDLPLAVIHENRISTRSRIIYTTVVFSVFVAFASLPFINVPVNLKSTGAIDASAQFDPFKGSNPNVSVFEPRGYSLTDQSTVGVSPGDNLIAVCYVIPSNIDMIRIDQQVSFQVDGFDSNTWGTLTGKVVKISDDLVLQADDRPVFQVQCSLDKSWLELNGVTAYLKKGMSLTAWFNAGDRNLFNMLRGKADREVEHDSHEQRKE